MKGKLVYFASIENVRFHKPVVPGDQVRVEVDLYKIKGPVGKTRGKCYVDGKVVVEAEMTFSMANAAMSSKIDASAKIHPSAEIGKDVTIGPNAFIGEGVKLDNGVTIEANVVIEKWTNIGEDTHIHYGAIIGNSTQDKKFKGEKSYVRIGKRNDIREYVTINRATAKDGATIIGDDNLLLTMVHIGHDCVLGSNIIMSNAVQVAGHILIEDRVNIGGMAGITQFSRIGKMAMIGGYSKVNQDVPPFMLVEGNPAFIRTLNTIGMERNGVANPSAMKKAYRTLFRSKYNLTQALEKVAAEIESTPEVVYLTNFLKAESHNGVMRGKAEAAGDEAGE
jgi:UDP-N-acetylglucosamine acyltransferase